MTAASSATKDPRRLIARARGRLARASDGLQRFSVECELAGPPGAYVFAGWSLLHQRVLDENPDLLAHVIRIDGTVPTVVLPFSAREVYLKTDVRVLGLYRAPNMTAKIRSGPSSLYRERIARSVLADRLAGSRHVHIPTLYRHGKGGRWLVEELIEGVPSQPADVESFLMGGAAKDFYGASTRMRAIGQRPLLARLAQELIDLDPSFPRITEQASLPVAIIHGDLQHHNLMNTPDGRFCLVDFANAQVAPVAADLARLFGLHPAVRGAVCGFLRSLDPDRSALPVEVQLALSVVYRSRRQRRKSGPAMRLVKENLAALRPA